jgi:hypothetical protein
MTAAEFIGNVIGAVLIGGFSYALFDLLKMIVKQPKQPFNALKLSSYPLVPDDEEVDDSSEQRTDGLRLKPVPVKVHHE